MIDIYIYIYIFVFYMLDVSKNIYLYVTSTHPTFILYTTTNYFTKVNNRNVFVHSILCPHKLLNCFMR